MAFNPKKYSDIGKAAPDVEKMQDLYFSLRDVIIDTVRRDVNPKFADELVENNKTLSEFLGYKKGVYSTLSSRSLAPEQVFQRVVQKGNSKQLQALVKYLPKEELNVLKGAFLNNLVKRNAEGDILFSSTLKALNKEKSRISVLFKPEELSEVTDLLKLGDAFGPAFLSSSQTGASVAFRDMFTAPIKETFLRKAYQGYTSSGDKGLIGKSGAKESKGLIPKAIKDPRKKAAATYSRQKYREESEEE
jgi:hypothetical protein